jgi:hypothetical protein
MLIPRFLATAALLAATVLVPAVGADALGVNAGTETATGGTVSATLSWDAGELGPRDARLTIERAGAVVFARTIPRVCGEQCTRFLSDGDAFQVLDLDGDAEPEVVLMADSFARDICCTLMGVYDLQADGTYREFVHAWKSSTTFEDLDQDGGAEIRTKDTRFEESLPLAIYRYERSGGGPRLVDVTRDFPARIREDAADAKIYFAGKTRPSTASDARTVVGTYVADQFLLGRSDVGIRELDKQTARGILGTPKAAQRFRRRLLVALKRYGYR